MSKRKRDPTFTASEKITLIDLVEKHFTIVECKKTDAVSMKNKIREWQIIATEFNSFSSIHPRDWAVLKSCWENLKKRAKQENTMRNQHHRATGGGPPKKFGEDPAIAKVLELIHSRISGFVNPYDSDSTLVLASGSYVTSQQPATEPANENVVCTVVSGGTVPSQDPVSDHIQCTVDTNFVESQDKDCETAETSTIFAVDWSQYTPNMLRETRNPALAATPSPSNIQLSVDQPIPDLNLGIAQEHPQRHNTPLAGTQTNRSRRRPVVRQRETQNLMIEKINLICKTNLHADEQHAIQMDILRIQLEKEKEILEQEKLKTMQEKLRLELLEKLKDS